jgi:hypothetical protein
MFSRAADMGIVHRDSPSFTEISAQWLPEVEGMLADEDCWVHGYEHQKTQVSLFLSIKSKTNTSKGEIVLKDFA